MSNRLAQRGLVRRRGHAIALNSPHAGKPTDAPCVKPSGQHACMGHGRSREKSRYIRIVATANRPHSWAPSLQSRSRCQSRAPRRGRSSARRICRMPSPVVRNSVLLRGLESYILKLGDRKAMPGARHQIVLQLVVPEFIRQLLHLFGPARFGRGRQHCHYQQTMGGASIVSVWLAAIESH